MAATKRTGARKPKAVAKKPKADTKKPKAVARKPKAVAKKPKAVAKKTPATSGDGRWILRTTNDLMTWLEDEYMSEVTISDIAPMPFTKAALTVRFTWWLHGTGGPSRVPYRVEATDVLMWTLDGEVGTRAIEFEPLGRGKGIRLAMKVPGRLVLYCGQLLVERGEAKKLPRAKKPFTAYSYFHVEGPGAPSDEAIINALGAPGGARVEVNGIFRQVMVGEAVWAALYRFPAQPGEYHWNVVRKSATDDEWHRALELPHRLGARQVASAWEFVGPPDEFLVAVGRA